MEGKCPVYRDIWEKFSELEEDGQLARFFGEVMGSSELFVFLRSNYCFQSYK